MEKLLALIGQYGYLIVFFGVMLESTGMPLPGETILLAAGVLAQRGHLDLGDAIVFGILGAVVGDQAGYWLGRKGGRPFVLRWGRYVLVTPRRLAQAEAFFARHGGKAVFLARFFSGFRVLGALVAGTSRMRWRTFLLYNALGGATWATAVVLVGYFLGRSLRLVERWTGRATLLLGAVLGVAMAFYLVYRWTASHRERLLLWRDAALAHSTVSRLGTRYKRQLRWLVRRLTPGQYLGLHLTAGLAAAALCIWLFWGVAEDVVTGDPLVRLDASVAAALHSAATPPLTTFFLAVSALGSLEAVAALALLAAAILAWRRLWIELSAWVAGVAGGLALDHILRLFFARPRPFFEHPLLLRDPYSFPSGHAMESLVVYGMLAYFAVLILASWRARVAVVLGAALLVLLIGFSRLYLGGHYLSDVVAGYAAGGLWLSALITGLETVRRRDRSRTCALADKG